MRLSVDEIARIVGGEPYGDLKAHPTRAIHDSRLVREGDLFVALPGRNSDGHDHLDDAFRKGARAALVSDRFRLPDGAPAIVVRNPLAALQTLASAWRDHLSGHVIGVTGSHGKTTTRALLAHFLRARNTVHETPANYNSEIGLPLALLAMSASADVGVFELGTESPGEIAFLASILRPSTVVLTGIGPSHLGRFETLEAIADEKWSLVESLPDNGLAFVHADDPLLRPRIAGTVKEVRAVGLTTGDLRGHIVQSVPLLELRIDDPAMLLRAPLLGEHNAPNLLLAVACALYLGISAGEIEGQATSFETVPHRLEARSAAFGTVLDDTYNANPVSTAAALRVLASYGDHASKRLFVFGEMRDLGQTSEGRHREIARLAFELGVDAILPIGDAAGRACLELPSDRVLQADNHNWAAAISELVEGPRDVVLVKGSRTLGLESLVDELLAVD